MDLRTGTLGRMNHGKSFQIWLKAGRFALSLGKRWQLRALTRAPTLGASDQKAGCVECVRYQSTIMFEAWGRLHSSINMHGSSRLCSIAARLEIRLEQSHPAIHTSLELMTDQMFIT
jgi:hypothetical protein